MSKVEKTAYFCDRCGKEIASTPYTITTARFMRVIIWWLPQESRHKHVHLCEGCWKAFEAFMKGGRNDG